MENSKIRFVIIGAGNVAAKYAEAFKKIDSGSLVGVVDIKEQKAEEFAQANGIAHYAPDLGSLQEKIKFDAVIISLPSGLHAQAAIEAARLKKHVLSEKPLDISTQKIDQMTSACRDSGVWLGCTFQHRTSEHNRLAREAIQSGKLGRIHIANAFLKNYRGQAYYDSAAWRGTWALDGGGPFMQQAAHTIDLMVWMMGRAQSVFASTSTVAHAIEVEDMGHAIVRYENGAQGVIEASTVVKPGYPNKIEVHGEKGSIILTEGDIVEWDVEGMEKPVLAQTNHASGAADPMAISSLGHEMIIRDFIESIRENRAPLVPPESARLSVELINAIYESARSGRNVKIN
ncbi:Gfo/Idh/MocA family oxidoreductase [candidate division KSB1 bacterium]|nr:Gfo/Idh/MocA family oxidoreductase [candidate division KSB1 bacterium]